MKSLQQLLFTGLVLTLILSSCTMEKRVYMSGYHMEWNKSKHKPYPQESADNDKVKPVKQNEIVKVEQLENENNTIDNTPVLTTNEYITASLDTSITPVNATPSQPNEFSAITSPEECDNIILKNKGVIKAKVTEITTDEIKYKNCDNLNGPSYTLKKSEVVMIKYPNGSTDIITPNNSGSSNKDAQEKKGGGFGIASFVLGIVGLFFAAIIMGPLAFIFGIIGTINRKLKGLAIAGLIIGFIDIILILILIGSHV